MLMTKINIKILQFKYYWFNLGENTKKGYSKYIKKFRLRRRSINYPGNNRFSIR